jgi:hypothetical protein
VLRAYRTYRDWFHELELKRPGVALLVSGMSVALGVILGTALASDSLSGGRVLWGAGGGFVGGAVGQSLRSRRLRRAAQDADASSSYRRRVTLHERRLKFATRRPLLACLVAGLASAWLVGLVAAMVALSVGWSLPGFAQNGFAGAGFVAGCVRQRLVYLRRARTGRSA